jgi:peptide/nickel transport system permease protein
MAALGPASRYLLRRTATGVATLLVVTVVVFGAVHLMPGSYTDVVLGPFATAQERANVRTQYGLDQPLPVQYARWLAHVAVGDLGVSMGTGEPVARILTRRVPVTAELTLLAVLFTLAIGIPLALFAGMARSRLASGAARVGGSAAMSTPDFVLASVFLYIFSTHKLWLPAGGYVRLGDSVAGNLKSMALPAITLGVFGVAMVVRTGRDAVATVLRSPHVTASVARGESTSHIVRHHVLRNGANPVVTVLAAYAGYLMGGAIIVEGLFSLPGLGQAVLTGITSRDYGVVQGTVLFAAAAFIAINMIADFAYGVIDPRVVASGRAG